MKPFVIYTHTKVYDGWMHVTFTKCYGITIEDAVTHFCIYMHQKFPALNTYNFCIQQLLPRSDFTGYDSVDGILTVHMQDATKQILETAWGHNHA